MRYLFAALLALPGVTNAVNSIAGLIITGATPATSRAWPRGYGSERRYWNC